MKCAQCTGFGYLSGAPSTTSAGGERFPCGACQPAVTVKFAALAQPEAARYNFGHCKDCPGVHSLLCCQTPTPGGEAQPEAARVGGLREALSLLKRCEGYVEAFRDENRGAASRDAGELVIQIKTALATQPAAGSER